MFPRLDVRSVYTGPGHLKTADTGSTVDDDLDHLCALDRDLSEV